MEIDRRTRSAQVVATIDNGDLSIPSGAFAEVTLRSDVGRDGIVVPEGAVAGTEEAPFVWVVADGVAAERSVNVRPLGDGRIEVVDGLQPGQTIVKSRVSAVSAGPVSVDGGVL